MEAKVNMVSEHQLSEYPVEKTANIQEQERRDELFAKPKADQIKGTSVRGGIVTLGAQGFSFGTQTVSMIILARLLTPEDFGVTGMVAALTGFLAMFGDIGLGAATIQRKAVTHEELSTLFWTNLAIGAALTILTSAFAPGLVFFYKEPRLFWVTIVSSFTFLLGGAGAQHVALLLRNMRYTAMAKIGVVSLGLSSAMGIGMAALGCGYWSLVVMALSSSVIRLAGYWIAVSWRPGKPMRGCGIRSMLKFGGTVTLNNLVVYISYNVEKVLLGHSFGAESLGVYGRAYQLLNLPLQQLHGAMYTVAFPALSAIQDNTERLCRSFLKGYSVLLALTVPITMASALFAEEIVQILLGPKWIQAIPILRLLTPTILVFGMINPFGWFLVATGRTGRSLKMAFVIAPTIILGIVLGLHYGPKGVALGYSVAMSILLLPMVAWAIHGTGITAKAFWQIAHRPLVAGLLAAAPGLALKIGLAGALNPILLFIICMSVCAGVYSWILLIIMDQKALYIDLLHQVFERVRPKQHDAKKRSR